MAPLHMTSFAMVPLTCSVVKCIAHHVPVPLRFSTPLCQKKTPARAQWQEQLGNQLTCRLPHVLQSVLSMEPHQKFAEASLVLCLRVVAIFVTFALERPFLPTYSSPLVVWADELQRRHDHGFRSCVPSTA